MEIIVSQPHSHRIDFRVDNISPELEEKVRSAMNFIRQIDDAPILQEDLRLKEMYGWFHGRTGLVFQFKWENDVLDAFVHLDTCYGSSEPASLLEYARYFFGSTSAPRLLEMRNKYDTPLAIGTEGENTGN